MTIGASSMAPLIDGMAANIGVLLPVALTIGSVLLAVRILPAVISRFTRH